MRILQLIDSLRPGGAERMAVNYANSLAKRIDGSFLCCTRMEGLLKNQLSPEVNYLFLKKKRAIDPKAFFKLRNYIKEHEIDIIQAHSSSWFLALQMKLSLPGLKLIWHDHFGRDLAQRKPALLTPASRFFDGIISVNQPLHEWAKENLNSKRNVFIPNFFDNRAEEKVESIRLKAEGTFKILCLANFRPQKDHLNLIKAFEILFKKKKNISLHLIGKIEPNDYSSETSTYIHSRNLRERIFTYGEMQHVEGLLKQCDMGVLSSTSEGLPLALLEYGKAGLPVVCTDVGECARVVGDYGKIVPPGQPETFSRAMHFYLSSKDKRKADAKAFQEKILSTYSEEIVLPKVLEIFRTVISK